MNRKVTSEEIERLSQKLFDTPPSDECFREIKREALRYLFSLDTSELNRKIDWMLGLKNEGCNFMNIFQGFTPNEQSKIRGGLSGETNVEIFKRQAHIIPDGDLWFGHGSNVPSGITAAHELYKTVKAEKR